MLSSACWPEADDPAARLGSAPGLVALHEPTPRLALVPRHVLQQDAPASRRQGLRRSVRSSLATIAIHLGFAAAFAALLTWRPTSPSRETEIPVEVVAHMPEPPAPKPAPPPEPPKPEPPKSPAGALAQIEPPPAPVAPDAKPPGPAAVQPPPTSVPTPPLLAPPTPPLLAPPPEPVRAATQHLENRKANLEPETQDAPRATHEARPVEAPRVLSSADPRGTFVVPPPIEPKPERAAPAPDAPKTPSETDKLAAALPMDTSALPASFRAVLSGNGAAVSAAYKGLVYGRFSHAAEIGERARRQHLKGQVIVAFTIDDEGRIKSIAVVQSSGDARVDALGLDMVRTAAPFPPPPPDAQRSFTPAFAFGE